MAEKNIVDKIKDFFGVHNGVYFFVEEEGKKLFIRIEDPITLEQLNNFVDFLGSRKENVEIDADIEEREITLLIKKDE